MSDGCAATIMADKGTKAFNMKKGFQMKTVEAKKWLRGMFLACVPLFLVSCEKDGAIGDGHDFGTQKPDVIVAIGDSITAGTGLAPSASYPSVLAARISRTVVNAGVEGQLSVSGPGRAGGLLKSSQAGFLLILYGANDIIYGFARETTVAALRSMVETARANKAIPVLATLTPATGPHGYMAGGIADLNDYIRRLAGEEGVDLVDLAGAFGDGTGLLQDDGLHPNEAGATRIAESFAGLF